MPMSEPLTPDKDVVFRGLLRLDGEPNQIPAELFGGFLERLANSCNMSLRRARIATTGLIEKIRCCFRMKKKIEYKMNVK